MTFFITNLIMFPLLSSPPLPSYFLLFSSLSFPLVSSPSLSSLLFCLLHFSILFPHFCIFLSSYIIVGEPWFLPLCIFMFLPLCIFMIFSLCIFMFLPLCIFMFFSLCIFMIFSLWMFMFFSLWIFIIFSILLFRYFHIKINKCLIIHVYYTETKSVNKTKKKQYESFSKSEKI